MKHELFALLARHHQWANAQIRDQLFALTPEQRQEKASPTHESVDNLVAHLTNSQTFFILEFRQQPFDGAIWAFPSFEETMARWRELDADLVAWLESVPADEVERTHTRDFGEYGTASYPLWQEIAQFFHHSIQHRTELGVLVSRFGHPGPELDLIDFMSDEWGLTEPA